MCVSEKGPLEAMTYVLIVPCRSTWNSERAPQKASMSTCRNVPQMRRITRPRTGQPATLSPVITSTHIVCCAVIKTLSQTQEFFRLSQRTCSFEYAARARSVHLQAHTGLNHWGLVISSQALRTDSTTALHQVLFPRCPKKCKLASFQDWKWTVRGL